MKQVSHSTAGELIERGARRLARARLHYGHGTDNPRDEAATLVAHALGWPQPLPAAAYRRRVGAEAQRRVQRLLQRRIDERIPAAYLTGSTFFGGLPMQVDARALIPRSPIAELVERRFQPWIDSARVHRILDLGTGSGCIAIACAKAFRAARVDAVDVSAAALELAEVNRRRHRLGSRLRLLRSDYFGALGRARYDIIVANPPYVGAREFRSLPPEYSHEPADALRAGRDGLDDVRRILRDAGRHLRPKGILVVEVGNSERALRRAMPQVPFVWLQFERGGGGVFLLDAAALHAAFPVRPIPVRPIR